MMTVNTEGESNPETAALVRTVRELEARERFAAMATLATGIAHEINNPLAAVLGNVDMALEMLQGGCVDLYVNVNALAALAGSSFDLVLCDLMMPEMSGEDVCREATLQWPHLARRFVFMTGGAFTPRGRRFLASVPAPVLEKPFHIQDLLRCVGKRLGVSRGEDSQQPTGTGAG